MIITLSEQERRFATEVGRGRNTQDHGWGLGIGKFDHFGDGGTRGHILGAMGEAAFSKFRGIAYDPPKLKASDVDGFEVRTVQRDNGRLPIRPNDEENQLFALVTFTGQSARFRVAGWITGFEGKEVGDQSDPGNRGRPAWFVEQKYLHSFDECSCPGEEFAADMMHEIDIDMIEGGVEIPQSHENWCPAFRRS